MSQPWIWINVFATFVLSDIQRWEDGFKAEFVIVNNGRLYDILMFVEDVSLEHCMRTCVQHFQCATINYNFDQKLCELAEDDFDEIEADTNNPGWFNFGTPERVNGGFSAWIPGKCSVTCGNGVQIERRKCDNPEPRYGGSNCRGETSRRTECIRDPCSATTPPSTTEATTPPSTTEASTTYEPTEAVWIRQASSLCYSGSSLSESGAFNVTTSGYLESVKLIHKSGWIRCGTESIESHWGCVYSTDNCKKNNCFGTVILNKSNKIVFPTGVHFSGHNNFRLNVYGNSHDGDTLIYPTTQLIEVLKNDVLKVTVGMVTVDLSMEGKHCIDVYFRYGTGNLISVALRKPSKQSSTLSLDNCDNCDAELANDGYFDTRSVTHFDSEKPWWEVDLQRSIEIKTMIIHLHPFALEENYYQKLVITTKNTETEDWTTCKNIGEPSVNSIEVKCDQTTVARYIRVLLQNEDRLFLTEVAVYEKAPELHYEHIGCYIDEEIRAISGTRMTYATNDVIQLCYTRALLLGYRFFAVQSDTQCFTSSDAGSTYNKYGEGSGCNDGRGGYWRNDVYMIKEFYYEHIGCYIDKDIRAISGTRMTYATNDVIQSCYRLALSLGYQFFAVQLYGQCYTSSDAGSTYNKYGAGTGCNDGQGGDWKNDVYRIKAKVTATTTAAPTTTVPPSPEEFYYEHIGCYKDDRIRAISGTRITYARNDIIQSCYRLALSLGYRFFAVQHAQCFTSSDAGSTYNKYGTGTRCNDGRGGNWKNDVYRIKAKVTVATTDASTTTTDVPTTTVPPIPEEFLQRLVGTWNVEYNGKKEQYIIDESGIATFKGTLWQNKRVLELTDRPDVFPSAAGWLKLSAGKGVLSSWQYLRINENGIMKLHFFSKMKSETYKGLPYYCCFGKGIKQVEDTTTRPVNPTTEVDISLSWTHMPGQLNQICVGDGKILVVTRDGVIYFRTGITSSHVNGTGWKNISTNFMNIAVGDGKIGGVSRTDHVYFRTGINDAHPEGTGWKLIDGRLMQISIGDRKIMGLSRNNEIWFRVGITQQNPFGSEWFRANGKLKHISVGDEVMVGVGDQNDSYFQPALNFVNPSGTAWTRIHISFMQIEVSDGKVAGIDPSGSVWVTTTASLSRPTDPNIWDNIPGKFRYITIGDGKVMCIDHSGNIFHRTWIEIEKVIGTTTAPTTPEDPQDPGSNKNNN